ncbi:HAMP domain-containing protein, partial [Neorhizobium lilium]
MTIFQNVKILTKISVVMLGLIVVSLAVAYISHSSSAVQSANANMTDHTHDVLSKLSTMMAAMVDQETGMRGYVIAGDQKFLDPQIAGAKTFQEYLAAAQQLTSDNPAQQTRLKDVAKLAEAWTVGVVKPEMDFMKDASTWDKARQIEISGAGKASMDGIRAKIKELAEAETSLLGVRKAAADAAAARAQFAAVTGGGTMLLLSAIGLFILNSALVKPLRSLNACMMTLVGGQNDVDVPGRGRKDEIGEMAAAVESFRQTAIAKVESDRQAAETRQTSDSERARAADSDRQRAQEMAEATNGLAEGLKHLAQGNMTFQLAQPFAPDFESLREDFNLAIEQLRGTLNTVAESGASIDS